MANGYGPEQQRRSFFGRFGIAILIVLIGAIMYMYNTEVNPVTGEKQHVAISPDQEIRLGLESAPLMAREMGGEVSPSDPRYQEVQRIGQQLVTQSEAANSPWKFKFHLLADTRTVNAFALPGGQIFITLGLYEKLQNEAQLAGVLSHEMGHVIERHTAEQMAKSQLGNMMIIAVGAAASDPSHPGGARSAAAVASVVNQMFQLRYSRSDESEADTWGLKIMSKAGYNPQQMIGVMEVLKKASGDKGRGPDFFQSHPNPDLRIEQIQAYLKEHPPAPGLTDGKPLNFGIRDRSTQDAESLWDLLFQGR